MIPNDCQWDRVPAGDDEADGDDGDDVDDNDGYKSKINTET